ncbi:MAG TPA: flagellar hook-length control protein FliK [Pseudomonas sp.]|nr:flagellar hook-length control protein FliK [Pseudomonas sp.]
MSLGADFLLPKASAVQAEQNLRGTPRDASQSGFADVYAQAREGGERPLAESSGAPLGQAAQIQAANDEQALAGLGNELPGSELPLTDEALLLEPEDVSLESLMLFGREGAAASSEALASGEQPVPVTDQELPADPTLATQAPEPDQPLAAEAVASQMMASAMPAAGVAQQAAASAAGVRSATGNLSETRGATRQPPVQPELNLATAAEAELAADGEQEFTEALRTSLAATAGSAAQVSADSPDSPVNPLTQAVQQANAAQREAAANALQQPLSMRQPGMSEAVVERVMWLSSQNLRSAEIQLDPAELGRLEIRISLNQEQTQISFASPHASVREALEGQMFRLREMFSQQGLDQFDVNVSDQSLARGDRQADERDAAGLAAGNGDGDTGDGVDSETLMASTPLENGRGLVDFYA